MAAEHCFDLSTADLAGKMARGDEEDNDDLLPLEIKAGGDDRRNASHGDDCDERRDIIVVAIVATAIIVIISIAFMTAFHPFNLVRLLVYVVSDVSGRED